MSAIASPARRRRAKHSRAGPSLPKAGVAGIVALACAAAGLTIALAYPIGPWSIVVAFLGWTALAALRPGWALVGLLALLPLAGFAPRTGWLIFEELDLLILATAAGGYAARAWSAVATPREPSADRRFAPGLSLVSVALLLCYLATLLLSMQRGMHAAGGFTFAWTQGFNGPLNSLRLFKGFGWALLLAPLTLDELRRSGGFERIGRGLTIGLGLASLAVVEERFAYIGLLDFSQDYRATGSFWEMHVGGATLDAFVLLTLPFAAREALTTLNRPRMLAAVCVVFGLAVYAALATFSRGLYFGMVVEAALLAIVALRRLLRLDGLALGLAAGRWAAFGIAVAVGDFVVFRHGGYRGVIAAIAVLALALRVGAPAGRLRPSAWLGALVATAILGLAGYGLAIVLPKGPYLVFMAAWVASALAIVDGERRPSSVRNALAVATWGWSAIAACVVADLWGGHPAGADSAAVMAALVAFVALTARFRPALWTRDLKAQSATLALALLIVAPVTVLSAGAYMGGRMHASGEDFQYRVDHWSEAIGRLRTTDDWLLGLGLGRYPASSLFSGGRSVPGTYAFIDRPGDRHVRLTGPGLPYLGEGEMFRFTQVVPVTPGHRYVLTLEARAPVATGLHVDLCEKHLIYSLGCLIRDVPLPADAEHWTRFTTTLDSGDLGRSPWFAGKAMVLALAVGEPRKAIDIRSVHLVGPGGVEMIANPEFGAGTARWFSSSDLNHPPFHTFNLAVGVLVDQGSAGLGLLVILVLGVLVRTVLGRAHRHPDAAFVAVALVGLLVLGIIDDPIDAPRIGFLFYFILLTGLMLRNPKVVAPDRSVTKTPTPPPAPPDSNDEAAARALRRQQAFGQRRRGTSESDA